MRFAPLLVLAVALLGDAVSGRPLWSVADPPESPASPASESGDFSEPVPDTVPPPVPVKSIYRTVETTGPTWPSTSPTNVSSVSHAYEIGTWTGLSRGRSGLDGGLYAALKADRLRPGVYLGPSSLGVGLGVEVFPLLGVTAGLTWRYDWKDATWAPGFQVGLKRW